MADLLDRIKAAKAQSLAESHALRAEARADAPDLPPQLIWGWAIEVHCPGCDSQLQHVTTGRPGLEVRAVAGCPGCGRTFTIAASLTDVSTDLGRHPRHRSHPEGCTCAAHRNRSAA